MNLTKSKQRVADHGEVFTPGWMVEAMLDLVKEETKRIDSRVFLEPACGSGNFLVPVLRAEAAAVEIKFGKSEFEKRHYALRASCASTESSCWQTISPSAARTCAKLFAAYLNRRMRRTRLYRAAAYVLV